ncbi:hypothetical protein K493DRAFT_332463 [Basidiobolus meristosporus CBS 931.73]|uniref:G-patch domain-containing protein n=1 Tax=Basidiobolus meristosporus CBS 931.73 TaxID=1314790 RepID=A0A1Y1ZD73_9FUNG|nr:hypothetical protein K493DRAFT_332463 [Basidiobolus meristosporus CBS 931.73]|eukprot:ORY08124.1 hypothetical protein K493DRAFT_332463 [Basidiobolus meristosporus CBS 931.73]
MSTSLCGDIERQQRVAKYLAEVETLKSADLFREESLSDDGSFDKINEVYTTSIDRQTTSGSELENTDVSNLSENESSKSASEDDELWKKLGEMSLVSLNRTPKKSTKRFPVKGSPQNSEVAQPIVTRGAKKKSTSEENARFMAVLNGSFPRSYSRNEEKGKPEGYLSVTEDASSNPTKGTFPLNRTQPKLPMKSNIQIKKAAQGMKSPPQKQMLLSEPTASAGSDSEGIEIEQLIYNNDSPTTNIQVSRRPATSEPVIKSKGKGQTQNEKYRQDKPSPINTNNQTTDIYHINGLIHRFVKDPKLLSISLQPMDKAMRQSVHLLANVYNLKSKSQGAGDKRYPVLYRTMNTTAKPNQGKIRRILRSNCAQRNSETAHKSAGKDKLKDKASTPSKPSRMYNPNSPVPPVGSVVGQFARPIEESNIGHQMLQKMGWSPGKGLTSGSSSGRATPVEVIVRGRSRRGLGGAL